MQHAWMVYMSVELCVCVLHNRRGHAMPELLLSIHVIDYFATPTPSSFGDLDDAYISKRYSALYSIPTSYELKSLSRLKECRL